MKKILLSAAAFGLAVGVATTASAAFDSFSVTGSYSVSGNYMSDGKGDVNTAANGGVDLTEGVTAGVSANRDKGADSFYTHTFNMDPILKVNDNITMKSRVRLASSHVWGQNDVPATIAAASGRVADIRRIYMEYTSPIGTWTVGRVPTGAWYGSFLNSEGQGNRIIYQPNFIPEPFAVKLLTQKRNESDATQAVGFGSDSDTDMYLANLEYKSSAITAAAAYVYNRAAAVGNAGGAANETVESSDIWLYGKGTFGFITAEAEMAYMFGDDAYNAAMATMNDRDALAAMLDVEATFGNLTVGGLYVYMSGQSYDNVNNLAGASNAGATAAVAAAAGAIDSEAAVAGQRTVANVDDEAAMNTYSANNDVGNDFQPYHILTGSWTGILCADNQNSYGVANGPYDVSNAGLHSFGLDVSFKVNDKLTIGGAIVTAWADEEQAQGQGDDYGVEYDMTVAYNLLDNLTYTVNLGYLDTGEFFEANIQTAANINSIEVNDIIIATNTLTMTF